MPKIELKTIDPAKFCLQPFNLWSRDWLLLSAGDFKSGQHNAMTVGWGSFGVMWGKPFAMIVVRPQRHTIGFLEQSDSFTLTAFPEKYHAALQFCGAKSGRDISGKAAAAGLTPCAAQKVSAPSYEEAELVIECRKNFKSAMEQTMFLNSDDIKNWYPASDFHRIYFGEILHISGTEKYSAE